MSESIHRCLLMLAVSLAFSAGCQETDEERSEDCIELVSASLVCIEKKTLAEARVDNPDNPFLQQQTEESWQQYTMCKTYARERWNDARTRELDDCKQFLKDFHEENAD